jgi:iron(III) transport system ATP-binding protein
LTAFVADFVGTMTFIEARVSTAGRVSAGGLDLAVARLDGLAPGTPVRLGFRPEEIQVRNVAPTSPNRVEARVALLDYLGSFTRAQLRTDGTPGLALTADFSANAMRDLAIREGDRIAIMLPPESLRVFPAAEAAP